MSSLQIDVTGARVEPYAALPLLHLRLRIAEQSGARVDTVALKVQVQIDPRKRRYTADEQRKLLDLFGEPARWGETMRAVQWAYVSVVVPPFTAVTEADLPIPCSYDFEVASAKYFDALEEGGVPLQLLFSGMVFSRGEAGFSAEMIPWHLETSYLMPARLWREAMDRFFPNQAWIRVRKDTFDELNRFRTQRALLSWEDTIDTLLASAKESV